MWDSSCASTPSSSRGSSRSIRPVVTQTVAVLRLCPAANALGRSICETAIFGFGRSASWQRRSIVACSSGASWGSVTRARIAARASLSPKKICASAKPPAISRITIALVPTAISAAMKMT